MSQLHAHVLNYPESDSITLQFDLNGVERQLVRQHNEELSRVLVRIERLVNPATKKRDVKASAKQSKPSAKAVVKAAALIVFKTSNQEVIPPTQNVRDAFLNAATLEINHDIYHIIHNQPRVRSLAFMVNMQFCGIPILPTGAFDFCALDSCEWTWKRGDTVIGTECSYTPTALDIGHALTLTCTPPPSEDGSTASPMSIQTEAIQAGPDRSVFAPRQKLGSILPAKNCLRLMTYNILYDKYARPEREVNRMYPFAAPGILQESYRMPHVVLEVLESNADLVCFQEMGEAICKSYFEPLLGHHGFIGHYAGKGGTTPEGCAIFARASKFRQLDCRVIKFAHRLKSLPKESPLSIFLASYPQIAAAAKRVPSILQLVTLQAIDSNQIVLVANTHMFYRADANVVRLVQTALLTQIVEELVEQLETQHGRPVHLIVAGDLNARPVTSSFQYLIHGHLEKTHQDWLLAHEFQWIVDENEQVIDTNNIDPASLPELSHRLVLESTHSDAKFTTYLRNHEFVFQDVLDYILIDPRRFKLLKTWPMFTHDQVDVEKSLPATMFPSDHVSLVCDVQYIQQ